MRAAYDVDAVRAAERALLDQLPDGALMQRAGSGLATVAAGLLGRVYGSHVVLLVGSGDNGGDALYAGVRLAARGARVDAVLLSDRAHPAGLASLLRAGGRVVTEVARAPDLVLDGIVGIGGRGALREGTAAVVEDLPPDAWVVAVDVPSGVDASTGEVAGPAVRADVTVTFGALKPGLLVDPGAAHAGVVELVPIGLDLPQPSVEILQAEDVSRLLPRPSR
ncbi:MAG: NAD(P)H-hydrate epimerase, partial [Actinomycetes bacterium]